MSSENQERISELMKLGLDMYTRGVDAAEKNMEKSKAAVRPQIRQTDLLLTSTLWKAARDVANKDVPNPTSDISYQFALLANLYQLIDPTQLLILRAQYVAAAALVRQGVELNARLAEIQNDRAWREGNVPNPMHLPLDAKRWYGLLSEITHFGRRRVGEITISTSPQGTPGQSLFPVVNPEMLHFLFDCHVGVLTLTLMHQVHFLENVFQADTSEYVSCLRAAVALLEQDGLLGKNEG